jgi:hypothetical protein
MDSEGPFALRGSSLSASQLVLGVDAHVRQGDHSYSIRTNASSENGAMHTRSLPNAQCSAQAL